MVVDRREYGAVECIVLERIGEWRDGWYAVPYRVIFRDVDSFGHVNNAVYFTYFELARTELWFAISGGSAPRDISFIVARAECDFREQIGMEAIEIRVKIAEMRSTSFDFIYEIRKTDGLALAATGKVVVVLFDWDTNAKVPIGDELRRKVRTFQQEA
jgi:acyl-CoA thioester hydrolase